MDKTKIINAYNYLNNAFSNYMVGDMNTPRCNYTDLPEEFADDLFHEGVILARKLIKYNSDKNVIKNSIKILINHKDNNNESSFNIPGNEGNIYNSKTLIESLCLCYQLDESRQSMIKSYVNGFLSIFGIE